MYITEFEYFKSHINKKKKNSWRRPIKEGMTFKMTFRLFRRTVLGLQN